MDVFFQIDPLDSGESIMAAPDMELKAAFAELQSKVVENKQKMKFHDVQIENLKRSITHSTLTDSEDGDLYHHQHIFRANHGKEFCRGETERLVKKSWQRNPIYHNLQTG